VKSLQFLRKSMIGQLAALAMSVVHAADADDGRNAIADAEKALAAAKAQNALWTSAEDALRQARRALHDGNAAAAARHARFASEQAALGIAQKQYSLTR
jgi:hypothetical protein